MRRIVRRWSGCNNAIGHTAIHETGIHGGPPQKAVAAAVVAMAIFGAVVLTAEVAGGGGDEHSSEGRASVIGAVR